jgi:hypothetical protein
LKRFIDIVKEYGDMLEAPADPGSDQRFAWQRFRVRSPALATRLYSAAY